MPENRTEIHALKKNRSIHIEAQNTEAGLVFVILQFVCFGFLTENLSSTEIKTKDNPTTASF